MNEQAQRAQRYLISWCLMAAVDGGMDHQNMAMWLHDLPRVLDDCEDCSREVEPLWVSASNVLRPGAGLTREGALARLRFEVRAYVRQSAARRLEHWQEISRGAVA